MSFLMSNNVFDAGKFKLRSLFSLVYRMRSWYIGSGSAGTNTTSSEKPSSERSVRKMLFSFEMFSAFKTVDSIWASLWVGVCQPLICWRQTGTVVLTAITSLRSSEIFFKFSPRSVFVLSSYSLIVLRFEMLIWWTALLKCTLKITSSVRCLDVDADEQEGPLSCEDLIT